MKYIAAALIVLGVVTIAAVTFVLTDTADAPSAPYATSLEVQVVKAETELAASQLEEQLQQTIAARFDALAQGLIQLQQQSGMAANMAMGVGQSLQNIWSTLYCDGVVETPDYLHQVYFEGADSLCTALDAYRAQMQRLFTEE